MADVSEVTFGSPSVSFDVGGFALKPTFPRYSLVVTGTWQSEPMTEDDAAKLAGRTQGSAVCRIDSSVACKTQNAISTR